MLARVLANRRVDVALASALALTLPLAYGDPFLKKAMLFLNFVAGYLQGQGVEVESKLTAFADYQVPNVLRHHGVLGYCPELEAKVAARKLLSENGNEEVAIRAATILACEAIGSEFGLSAEQVDWWCFQQRKAPVQPFHLTESSYY